MRFLKVHCRKLVIVECDKAMLSTIRVTMNTVIYHSDKHVRLTLALDVCICVGVKHVAPPLPNAHVYWPRVGHLNNSTPIHLAWCPYYNTTCCNPPFVRSQTVSPLVDSWAIYMIFAVCITFMFVAAL